MFEDIQKQIRSSRRKVISELKKIFTPRMWESGYRVGPIGNSRPMLLWTPKEGKRECVHFRHGKKLTEFWGITEIGFLMDSNGYGCLTEGMETFPIEDLIMLHKWAVKHFANRRLGIITIQSPIEFHYDDNRRKNSSQPELDC